MNDCGNWLRPGLPTLDLEDEPVDSKEWRDGLAALQRSVVRHALSDIAKGDNFSVMPMDAALLEASGSLKKRLREDGPSESVLAALADRDSDLRASNVPPGRLFFHRDSGEKTINVFPARDLLIYPNFGCRKAAVEFFRTIDSDASLRLAKTTTETLKGRKRQALGKSAKTWYPAMLDIQRVLDHDWMLNLAGRRQALITKENSWIGRYWNSCVCPKIHPANSTPKEAFFAATDEDWVGKQISEIGAISGVDKLIDEYLLRFRHLPLDDPYSLKSVLESSMSSPSDWSVAIKRLLDIATESNYLRVFHACRTLVAIAHRLTAEEKNEAVRHITAFLKTSWSDGSDTPMGRHWMLLRTLASHFAKWIPFYGPQLGADNTTSLAWWLADNLCDVILEDVAKREDPKTYFQHILDRNVKNVVRDTDLISQYYAVRSDGSFFHFNSIDFTDGGPFLFSLLAGDTECFRSLFADFDQKTLADVLAWYTVKGVLGIGGHAVTGSLVFQGVPSRLQGAIEAIASDFPEDQIALILGSVDDLAKLEEGESLAGQLKEFPSLDQNAKIVWLKRLSRSAREQKLPADDLARFLWKNENRTELIGSLDEAGLATLLLLLMQLLSYADRDYGQQLPFLLLSFLDCDLDKQQQHYFAHAIVSAAATNRSFSAVDELVKRSSEMPELKSQLELEHQFVNYVKQIAPRWVWSRVRPLVSKLPTPKGAN